MAQGDNEYLRQIAEAFRGNTLTITGSENMAQVGGTAVSTNAGTADAGTQRVVQATITYTPNFVSVGASASSNIPATAKSWSFVLLTGTGTLGGVAVPLGIPVSGGALAALLAYTTAGASSAYVFYET